MLYKETDSFMRMDSKPQEASTKNNGNETHYVSLPRHHTRSQTPVINRPCHRSGRTSPGTRATFFLTGPTIKVRKVRRLGASHLSLKKLIIFHLSPVTDPFRNMRFQSQIGHRHPASDFIQPHSFGYAVTRPHDHELPWPLLKKSSGWQRRLRQSTSVPCSRADQCVCNS